MDIEKAVDFLKNLGHKQVDLYDVRRATSIHDTYVDDASNAKSQLNNWDDII